MSVYQAFARLSRSASLGRHLGASQALIRSVAAVRTSARLPMCFCSGWLAHKHSWCLCILSHTWKGNGIEGLTSALLCVRARTLKRSVPAGCFKPLPLATLPCQLICWMASLSHEHPAPDRYTTQQPPHTRTPLPTPPGLYITFNTLTVTVYNVSILQNHSANSRIAERRLRKINNPLGQPQSISEREERKEREVGKGAILALIDFSISCMNDYSMLAKWNGVINLSLGLFRQDLAPEVKQVLQRRKDSKVSNWINTHWKVE